VAAGFIRDESELQLRRNVKQSSAMILVFIECAPAK
jgi:hypothetical protein